MLQIFGCCKELLEHDLIVDWEAEIMRPKENAYFCPEELVSTLMDMSIRVGRSYGHHHTLKL